MIRQYKIISGISIQNNIVKDNIPKITNCLSKNVTLNKSLNNLNIDFFRNYNSGNLGITRSNVNNNNLNSNNIKLLKNTYSTNTNLTLKYLKNNNNILLNGKGLNIKEEKPLNNEKVLNNAINAMNFSSYNKRFISTINEINQHSENSENLNNNEQFKTSENSENLNNNEQFKTNLKENGKMNNDSKKENNEGPNFSYKQETKNEKNEKNLISLIKKYGIIAIIVHGTLSCIIYFTTLGIVLYYDIDPDELTKQSKLYISKMTKKLLGKVDNIEIKDIIHHNTKKQDPSNSEKEGEPTDKKKKLLKTMVMTYAAVHIFSPAKTMLTLVITPYLAKLLKKSV